MVKYISCILLIVNYLSISLSVASQDIISNKKKILEQYYLNQFENAANLGIEYLLSDSCKRNTDDDLVVLTYAAKALFSLSESNKGLEFINQLRSHKSSKNFNRYLSVYEAVFKIMLNEKSFARELYLNLLRESEEQLPDSMLSKVYHNLAICYSSMDLSKEYFYYKKGFEIAEKLLQKDKDYEGYNLSAASYIKTIGDHYRKFDEAMVLYREILSRSFNKKINRGNEFLYMNYLNLCKSMGLTKEFVKVAKQLEEFYKSYPNMYNIELSGLYIDLGARSYIQFRYTEALNYFQKSLIYSGTEVNYRNNNPFCCMRISEVYNKLGNPVLSRKYVLRSIDEAKRNQDLDLFRWYAVVGKELGYKEKMLAEAYLDSAKNDALAKGAARTSEIYNLTVAEAWRDLGEYDKSLDHYWVLQEMYLNDHKFSDLDRWEVSINIGLLYIDKKEHKKAIDILSEVYKGFEEKYKDDLFNNFYSSATYQYKKACMNLVKAYYGMYQDSNKSIYLKKAYDYFAEVDQLSDKLRSNIRLDVDQMAIGDEMAEYTEMAIKVNCALYNENKDEKYLNSAYNYIQKGKSYSLLLGVNDRALKEGAGVPDKLINLENNAKAMLSSYQNEIDQIKSRNEDESNLSHLIEKRDFYVRRMDSINQVMLAEYPTYKKLKDSKQIVSVKELQSRLGDDKVMVDYFMSQDKLYQFVITQDEFKYYESPIDSEFYANLNSVIKEVSMPFVAAGNSKEKISQYAVNAYALYQKLLGNIEPLILNHELIIVPHAELSYLPFEALLTRQVENGQFDMRKFPWLIKEYPVSYEYNAALLPSKDVTPVGFDKVLAFAPEYRGDGIKGEDELIQRQVNLNEMLKPLPEAKFEVESIGQLYETTQFIGKEATKSNFLSHIHENDVMHLAMHSLNDEVIPLNSQLVFASVNDTSQVLKAYEIYHLNIQSPMVVLSSCNTGRGIRKTGEGLLSLARAFKFSGVKTQLFTLWPVNDDAGAQITQKYYQKLKEGQYKDQSLRESKVNFINSSGAIKAHPYYWANYVISGDLSPLKQDSSRSFYLMMVLLFISVIGYSLYRIKRE